MAGSVHGVRNTGKKRHSTDDRPCHRFVRRNACTFPCRTSIPSRIRNVQGGHAGNGHIIPAGAIYTFSMHTALYRYDDTGGIIRSPYFRDEFFRYRPVSAGQYRFACSEKTGERTSGNRQKHENAVLPDTGRTVLKPGPTEYTGGRWMVFSYTGVSFASAMRLRYVPERYMLFSAAGQIYRSRVWLCS